MTTFMPLVTTGTVTLAYFACFHSIMSSGFLFWGKATDFKKTFSFKKENS
jgi:hypothetical protein